MRTAHGVKNYEAQADSLFGDMPMVVLIDGTVRGSAEWLAAALQDNGRATLIGTPTPGAAYFHTTVSLSDDLGGLMLLTGVASRADGRSLVSERTAFRPRVAVRQTAASGRFKLRGIETPRVEKTKGTVHPDQVVTKSKLKQAIAHLLGLLEDAEAQAKPTDQ